MVRLKIVKYQRNERKSYFEIKKFFTIFSIKKN